MAPNGNQGNNVGSSQPHATALPRRAFTTDSPGEHTHVGHHLTSDDHYAYYGSTWQVSRQTSGSVTTPDDGAHYHTTVAGGDDRTVPVNMATFFIIKYQ